MSVEDSLLFAQTAMVAGELSLNGELRSIPGVLSMTMCAKERGFNAMILPRSCAS
ncbi:MAG: magnesium chelatase domain-containing protein [Clostridia bacterium]